VDPLGSLLIAMMARFFLFILTRKEVAMAKPHDRSTAVVNSLNVFVKDTVTSFGLVVILKAVMVPHALRHPARGLNDGCAMTVWAGNLPILHDYRVHHQHQMH
jgi:hypothetical protein